MPRHPEPIGNSLTVRATEPRSPGHAREIETFLVNLVALGRQMIAAKKAGGDPTALWRTVDPISWGPAGRERAA
jgi:hypothetical protein